METTAAPPSACLARYAFRKSILESEKTYALYPDRLEIQAEGEPPEVHPLADVETVHLKFERTRQRGYFQCFIHARGGRIMLRHVHWGGIGSFQDRRETYTPFVRALLRALAQVPGVRFKAGSLLNFASAIIGLPLMLILGVLTLVAGLWPATALAALMVFVCASVLRRSRPRAVDPLNPPEDVLPM